MTTKHLGTGQQACLIGIAILLLAGFCFGQPAVSLSPKEGPPTTTLQVSGSGFTPYAAIDIYFDSKDEAVAMADGSGAFSKVAIQAPKSAVPGNHWVSVVERSGHNAKQEIFEVRVNWTEFHTIDMGRYNPYENVLNVNNVGNLEKVGSYPTGSYVESSPAVVNGVVYVGSDDHTIYALNTHTGRKLWGRDLGGDGVVSSPAVANGVVYVGGGDDEPNVIALNASTGALLWSYFTGYGSWMTSSPTVVKGVVYIGSVDTLMNSRLYALNAGTGALIGSYLVYDDYVGTSPAVANGVVYVGTAHYGLYALNTRTGALLWNYVTGQGMASPAVANGVVYVGSGDNNVYALNASTGALLWSYPTGGAVGDAAVATGVVYVGSGDNNIYALNASTGALLWSDPIVQISSPAVANGVVYVGSDDHSIYALDALTGMPLWSYPTGGPVESSPAVANGVVYIGSGDNNAYAFGLPRGLAPQPPKRPDPKTLRPDFSLRVSQPVAITASAN